MYKKIDTYLLDKLMNDVPCVFVIPLSDNNKHIIDKEISKNNISRIIKNPLLFRNTKIETYTVFYNPTMKEQCVLEWNNEEKVSNEFNFKIFIKEEKKLTLNEIRNKQKESMKILMKGVFTKEELLEIIENNEY